jgi:hypothetical protein
MGSARWSKYHKKAKQDTIALVPQANKGNRVADTILDSGGPGTTEVSRNERRGGFVFSRERFGVCWALTVLPACLPPPPARLPLHVLYAQPKMQEGRVPR